MRELTQSAQAAKQIRTELKRDFPQIKFKVTSDNYSMGSSVSISWTDGPNDQKVREITDKYQYGHFDGMTDMYEYSNDREDIPQAKYVMASRSISDNVRKLAFDFIKKTFSYDSDFEVEREVHRFLYKMDLSGEVIGFETFKDCGLLEDICRPIKKEPEKHQPIEVKGNFEIVDYSEKAIAIFGNTKPIKEALKSLGGKFNFRLTHNGEKQPGWIFSKKQKADLEKLISGEVINQDEIKEIKEVNLSKSLREKAEKTQQAADKIDDSVKGNWTHRRAQMAESMRQRKETTNRTANILFKLADLWESGNIPEHLKGIKSRSDVEFITHDGFWPTPPTCDGWYKNEYPKYLKKVQSLGIKSKNEFDAIRNELRNLGTTEKSEEEIKAEKIKSMEDKLRTANIPGFFPTPPQLIDKLLELADIQEGENVLEPSAGIGSICDKIKSLELNNKIHAIELQHSCYEILEAKGYELLSRDFMQYQNGGTFNKIVMNPPFENLQDIDHIKHAYDLLAPNGRIVCVMANNKNGSRQKINEFNEWLDNVGGYYEVNEESFNGSDSFRQTGVSTITVVIDK